MLTRVSPGGGRGSNVENMSTKGMEDAKLPPGSTGATRASVHVPSLQAAAHARREGTASEPNNCSEQRCVPTSQEEELGIDHS